MKIGRYRFLAQHSATAGMVSYRAAAENGQTVEVRVFPSGDELACPLPRRRLQLVALLRQRSCQRVEELALDHTPPYVVLEWLDAVPLSDFPGVPALPLDALRLAADLASGLVEAHRLGLAHGHLSSTSLHFTRDSCLKIDFASSPPATVAQGSHLADFSTDVQALGGVLTWLLLGRQPPQSTTEGMSLLEPLQQLVAQGLLTATQAEQLSHLLDALLAQAAEQRPTAAEALRQVESLISTWTEPAPGSMTAIFKAGVIPTDLGQTAVLPSNSADGATRQSQGQKGSNLEGGHLGRFRLLAKIGQGGMGEVYRALDPLDDTTVAIKILRPGTGDANTAVQRFLKEARLLAEVNNPYVANLLEVNEDGGRHYLVMEYLAGPSLAHWLSHQGSLNETEALTVLADVARALAEAHDHGIIHRDIKPDNILFVAEPGTGGADTPRDLRVKLTDFGLARHVLQTESLQVTQAGAILGTPYYMAPEQFRGANADARTDVYSLGATLFHMLTDRPPFLGTTTLSILSQHSTESPPKLQSLNPALSDAVSLLVERMLAKDPQARPANARAVLGFLEQLLRGEPLGIALHPRRPNSDPAHTLEYTWTWQLESSPRELWPYVSNTERLNRAIGLSAVQFSTEVVEGPARNDLNPRQVRRSARMSKLGLSFTYTEHPFEWIEARRMGVLREFESGPFKWFTSEVELNSGPANGTLLTHRVRVEPHGLLGRTVAAVEIGVKAHRALTRTYRRMDNVLRGKLGAADRVDPFEEAQGLSSARQRRLDRLLGELSQRDLNAGALETFGDYLAQAPAQEVARIRPLALARRLHLDADELVRVCLHGANAGLLILLWDILCPVCRVPAQIQETLRALAEHGHCEACRQDFPLDFSHSVELIFRVHPEIRPCELGTYCVGGPAHSPHVIAQVRLAPEERFALDVQLPEGAYRLRGPQLLGALEVQIRGSATTPVVDLKVPGDFRQRSVLKLGTAPQTIGLTNTTDQELLVRLERTAARTDALTAARAGALALFRQLFPREVLSPNQLVSVANITLLVTELEQSAALYEVLGDSQAFTLIHEYFRVLEETIGQAGGAVIKTVGESVWAVFPDAASATATALILPELLAVGEHTRDLRLRVGVHRGPALAATLNDRLDYFGATVHQAAKLPHLAAAGGVVLDVGIATDPEVIALLTAQGRKAELLPLDDADQVAGLLLWTVSDASQKRSGSHASAKRR